jgi:hypothetical protein
VNKISAVLSLLILATALAAPARADLYSSFVSSVEWRIDSSDVIVVVEVAQTGRQKTAKTEAVLKSVRDCKLKDWPHPDLVKLVAELPPGRRLLVFCRYGKDKVPHIRDVICLNEDTKLPRCQSLEEARYLAVAGSVEGKAKQGVCAALTKEGKLLTKPDQVLTLVENRIAQGSRVPADCDRDRVEQPYSGDVYGGGYYRCNSPFDTNEVIHHVLVPWEPEFEKDLLETLGLSTGASKVAVVRQLANYRSPETIAALKACLEDTFVGTKSVMGVEIRTFAVREAAYESLRRVEADRPLRK